MNAERSAIIDQASISPLQRLLTRRELGATAAGALAFGIATTAMLESSPHKYEPQEPVGIPEVLRYSDAAKLAYNAMNSFKKPTGIFTEATNQSNPATDWTYSRVLDATTDVLRLTHDESVYADLQDRIAGLANYQSGNLYAAQIKFTSPDKTEEYFDDNAWVDMNLLRSNKFVKNPKLVDISSRIFNEAVASYKDGIFWLKQKEGVDNHDRNTVSNGPYVEIGTQLYQLTQNSHYLRWAQKFDNFVDNTLFDAKTRLYNDHIDEHKHVDTTKWSYNQGIMIGAKLKLGQTMHDPLYTSQAESLAYTSLQYFSGKKIFEQPIKFNAVYFRNLLYLSAHTSDNILKERISASFTEYSDHLIQNMVMKTSGFMLRPKPDSNNIQLIDQASAVQILALRALDPSEYSSVL